MIGENIKRLRKERGLSQTELALMLGIKQPKISEFERGRRKPNRRMVMALASFFRVTLLEIDPDFEFVFLARQSKKGEK